MKDTRLAFHRLLVSINNTPYKSRDGGGNNILQGFPHTPSMQLFVDMQYF